MCLSSCTSGTSPCVMRRVHTGGTLEVSQNLTPLRALEGERRLLDDSARNQGITGRGRAGSLGLDSLAEPDLTRVGAGIGRQSHWRARKPRFGCEAPGEQPQVVGERSEVGGEVAFQSDDH